MIEVQSWNYNDRFKKVFEQTSFHFSDTKVMKDYNTHSGSSYDTRFNCYLSKTFINILFSV